ncbi:hypothetical protein GobsT_48390 [Gemmata obscuriglobus]|uniref:Uncharacterized protein n=1 Tax=Gemmata obscuriglobus TaxID=114 RepID=A0A2Z3GX47_9BACT|nr:hypothetical protein C1280_09410 [Gemmata obscuriglobus]QEG30039.1 hypothetical protein GobsT_48390 [Gemmata obscuriglobus]VTS09360.1 Uncharacterized protein OS=Caldilinea aerophila (strain DSM 14535 / JCM 11387 / NBRC 104270 / STL-6-O1) GN=CLDAP_06090 PE=4 SV=1 [Gemmata obscuriglobus UQM 2246]
MRSGPSAAEVGMRCPTWWRGSTGKLATLDPRHGGGRTPTYGATTRDRIVREVTRTTSPEADGAAVWSLAPLRRVLRAAPDGLAKVSTFTIRRSATACLAPFGATGDDRKRFFGLHRSGFV